MFYILANKYDRKLGFFLIRINENDPQDYNFVIKLKHKLDIQDAAIFVMRHCNNDEWYKELIVAYKTIYNNTYTINVIDISDMKKGSDIQRVIYMHESFHLCESQVAGFLLQKNNDFVSITDSGISIVGLGHIPKRTIMAQNGNALKLHSLESIQYLKIDLNNSINFEFSGDKKTITLCQQYSKV